VWYAAAYSARISESVASDSSAVSIDGLAFYSLARAGYGEQMEAGELVETLGIRELTGDGVHVVIDAASGSTATVTHPPAPYKRRWPRSRPRIAQTGATPIRPLRVTSAASASSSRFSVPAGRRGRTM
jgi:hypothetical protein